MPSDGGLDAIACLRQGSIGALGAIPGTMCAHPMDVLKIRYVITIFFFFNLVITQCLNLLFLFLSMHLFLLY